MALDCGQLKRGIAALCEPDAAGLKTSLVLVRYADIAALVANATNPKRKTLALAANAKGFLFVGLGDSHAARAKLSQGKFAPSYLHEVDCVAFGIGPENYDTVETLAKDPVVAIVPDNNGNYLMFGRTAGLKASKADTDSADKDAGGAPQLTLSSDKEKGLADFFSVFDQQGNYDPVATKQAFQALYS